MSLELKQFLLNCYPVLVSREAHHFRIDDIKKSDEPSMGCHIYVKVTGLDRMLLHLTNAPMNREIEDLVKSKGGDISARHGRYQIALILETADSQSVFELSDLIGTLPEGPGRSLNQDHEPLWRRTADSLSRFASLVRQYEKQTRGMEKTRPDGLFTF